MTNHTSWGKYPKAIQKAHNLGNQSDLPLFAPQLKTGFLPYGNGRSYGDSCLAANTNILRTRMMDRFILADWQSGIIRAEAGILLSEILTYSIKNGWFLTSTPGTKLITLGGALANDVHGKNHHVAGTFGRQVRRFGLYRSDNGYIECSPEENTELFAATIAGLGLTGVILWVEIQLRPIQSSLIDSQNIKFSNVDDFFTLSKEIDSEFDYTVAWVDCVSSGSKLGRGIYMVGNHSEEGELTLTSKTKFNVPIELPFSAVNELSLRVFNFLYYHKQFRTKVTKLINYEPFFYPLDAISNWNRIYGRPGFQQYQCVIPEHNAHDAMKEILSAISTRKMGSFLAVLKRCGDIPSPGLLSFPMQGITLALDFPNIKEKTASLFELLDHIVRLAGGRLYPAKDAHMSAEFFQQSYPKWEKLEAIRDPEILSMFWQRVTQ